VHVVVLTPVVAVAVGAPLLVDVEEREVVGRTMNFSRFASLSSSFPRGWKKMDGIDHGDDGGYLSSGVELLGNGEHLGEGGVQGELDHLAAELGELARVIEGAQGPELVHGGDVVVLRGRVHEVEVRRFLTPRILRRRTTSARLVRWISGMVLINISCL